MSFEKFEFVGALPNVQTTFLELDQGTRLPNGWEKCLDLKSGAIYYRSLHTGLKTNEDPRKHLKTSSNSFPITCSGAIANSMHLNSVLFEEKNLSASKGNAQFQVADLDLKLCLPGCYEDADFQRTKIRKTKQAVNNSPNQTPIRSIQSSLSSLSSLCLSIRSSSFFEATSSPELSLSQRAPCNSWISSSSSSPSAMSFQADPDEMPEVNSSSHAFQISRKGNEAMQVLVTVGCQRCLMYVMLSKENPQCPRCGNMLLLDFPSAPENKPSIPVHSTLKRKRLNSLSVDN